MRIFVAGATGAVGRRLVPLLVAAGHEVTGGTRTPQGAERLRAQGASAVRVDVFDADSVHRAVAAAAPEAVVHQLTDLAHGDRAANGRIRRAGTRHLVDAAKRAGVTRIVAQSISWAYAPGDAPADESTPLDTAAEPPRAGMVGSLRALEETAAEIETHVVLRYGTFYGPGTWYARGGPLEAALRGEQAAGGPVAALIGPAVAGDAVSSFVHVEDAARAAVAALGWPSGTVNVVDDEPAPARAWLPAFAAAVGAPAPAPAVDGGRAGWERGADNTLARRLGWRPLHPTWRTGFTTL
ncbi:dTDP-glucose 4,6-dehydratase [Streptomyces bingchenggensis BCW-1]|uniref:dTDP-glucose 4,6-dehydratase n=1 Tax=Streptomyces bingchenggensis (strain BCW-1) TaxID=749414 RepID=D7C907_STRBB|nr:MULTISPECIES: NAD(P)-dependent oxidoreductase [Streptomyces]ADI08558.1 dTDP-glucose 4,6-dehydratase [Streptomyces bingchenggensis BCW-1]